jgi:hypothetical protein
MARLAAGSCSVARGSSPAPRRPDGWPQGSAWLRPVRVLLQPKAFEIDALTVVLYEHVFARRHPELDTPTC